MKFFTLVLVMTGVASFANAEGHGKSYSKVVSAQCEKSADDNLKMDLKEQTIEGKLNGVAFSKLNSPYAVVKLTENFYDSGLDVLGGHVEGKSRLGTYVIILDKPMQEKQQMPVLYLTAIAGQQFESVMDCVFNVQ